MGTIFIIFGISVLLFILAVVAGNNYEHELAGVLAFFGGVALLISIISSTEVNITEEWIETKVQWVKTDRMVIVDDGERTWEFEAYSDVTAINDSTKFFLLHTTNFWDIKDVEGIKYENQIEKSK